MYSDLSKCTATDMLMLAAGEQQFCLLPGAVFY